jgi:cytochrome P450
MLLFPSVAQTARKELDLICGSSLPTLAHAPSLPYIRAMVKETMRWMPTAIMGVPHAAIRDDEYMGYRIPAGAGIIMNVWTVQNDPARHPNPRRFDPSRYLNDTLSAAESANHSEAGKRDHFLFGAGRRLCQGMHIAERSMFLAIARLLWAFEFHCTVDEQGREVRPDSEDLTDGFLVHPKHFPASIVPRDGDKVRVVREEWAKMEGLLDGEGQWKTLPQGLIWKAYDNAAKVG